MLIGPARVPAASSLGSLVVVVTMTLVMPPLYPIRAFPREPGEREQTQDAVEPAAPTQEEKQALEAFLVSYRLAPGQNLKLVPPPRPEGIRIWHARNNPGGADRQNDVRAMLFGWRDPDRLRVRASMFGGKKGWDIRDLPRWMNIDIDPEDIEGDKELLTTEIGGDWIVREGVPAERLIPALEAILQRELRLRITLSLRHVERDVVVARGRYRFSPLPGHAENEIEIYAREVVKDGNGGGGAGTFPDFIKWVSAWIGRPIVNEVEAPPTANVRWTHNERQPSTAQTRREDRDEALVLKHLQEQTGLTFTREKRTIRILFVERPGASRGP